MKKLLVILAAGLLVCGVAGQAKATYTFNADDLVRVVYYAGASYEEATDLGSVTSIAANPSTLNDVGYNLETGSSVGNFSSRLTGGGTVEVAYFAVSSSTADLWTSGSGTLGATETNNGYNSANGVLTAANNAIVHAYSPSASNGSTANAWYAITASGSTGQYGYYRNLDKGGAAIGSFDQFYGNAPGDGEIALAVGGSAQQGLFHWTIPGTLATIFSSLTLTTTINSAGLIQTSAIAPASATPIPPSVLLLGSGLLGLVGIRRRNLFNF